jgi:hypothetical protein
MLCTCVNNPTIDFSANGMGSFKLQQHFALAPWKGNSKLHQHFGNLPLLKLAEFCVLIMSIYATCLLTLYSHFLNFDVCWGGDFQIFLM